MQKLNLSVELQNGTIDANFDSIKAALAAELDTYKKMVFTEDSKKDAKDTVAYLRKFNKALDDKRKEVKKAYMAPCDAFEAKVNELKKQVDEPIKFINDQAFCKWYRNDRRNRTTICRQNIARNCVRHSRSMHWISQKKKSTQRKRKPPLMIMTA